MRALSVILLGMCLAVAASLIVPPIMRGIDLNVTCVGYLDRAANANTAKLAVQQLDKAIADIERRGWTSGSTRVFFDHPQCDMGYWYANLLAARAELAALPDSVTPLEQSNLLMKLRETLTEQGEKGQHLIRPPMINYYPHQMAWFLWWIIGTVLMFALGIFGAATWDA